MMTCEELSQLIAGDRLPRRGWRLRLAVRLHLLLCRHCRNYVRQLAAIGAEARRRWAPRSDDAMISSIERRVLRDALRDASRPASLKGREDDGPLPE